MRKLRSKLQDAANRRNLMVQLLIGLIAVWLLMSEALVGQELAGRIDGSVLDETGAAIVGATVTATHVGTNTTYRATTSAAGTFAIPKVRLGRYNVTAEAPNFRRTVVQNVQVEIGGIATLNITMQVGAIQEEVVVESTTAQELVNTVDAELGTVVDERRVLELPLNGRNASHLALLQAGVYFERDVDGQGDKLIIHGQRHRSLNISLDGIDTQDNLNRASSIMLDQPLLALSAENVQEFRVVTGISSAEFSRGGVQIAAVTRAGTNEYKGSLFWFHRNDVFNANDFFNNSAGVEVPKLIRNQFGGRVGGPIWRNKTFFFFGYQQTREARGISQNRTVYTAEARRGLFRYLDGLRTTPENVARNPGLIRSVDLLACGSGVRTALNRDCVDNRFNAANPATIDPFIGGTVLAAYPLPNNFVIGDGLNTGGFRFNAASLTVEHLPSFRLDHRLSDKHNFYATFNYIDRRIDGDFINAREPRFPGLRSLGDRLTVSRGYSAGLTSTFTPTVVNEFRFGYLGGENAFLRNQPFGTPFTLDLNTINDVYEPGGGDSVRDNVTAHLRDTISWVRGKHQFKGGGEWRHRWLDNYTFGGVLPFGSINFNRLDHPPGFSRTDLIRLSGAQAMDTTDFNNVQDLINNLVGAIGSVNVTYNVTSLTSGFVPNVPERRIFRTREFDAFFQDIWNIRSNFTLNWGLRWEFATSPIETRKLALLPEGGDNAVFGVSGPRGFFSPGTLAGSPCSILGTLPQAVTTANVRNLITSCATKNVPGGSNNGLPLWKNDYNNFGPVLGLAWDPWGNGKTSIRAGFRISYMQDSFSISLSNVGNNGGLTVAQQCIPGSGNCLNNPTFLRNVARTGPPVAPVPTFQLPSVRSILDSATQDFRTFRQGLATPYYEEWTLGIQREILPNMALEARYVGNRGVKLRRIADFNEININARDPVSGMTFLQAFVAAQQNLACNRANGAGDRFDTMTFPCSVANPLMTALMAGDPTRMRNRPSLLDALAFNEPGEFAYRLTQSETSLPAPGQSLIRGGSFWGAVLSGRLPVNFFQANPFVASSRMMINDSFSTYHALELELRQRLSRGLTVQANYTFGKALADYDGDENTLINSTRPSSIRNARSTIQQIMPRHQFNVNWIYELPFGSGKPLGAGASRVLGQFISGWQFGGIINWRSGRPLSITSGRGTFHRRGVSGGNTVNLSQRLGLGQIRDLVGQRTIGSGVFWFDPCLSSQIRSTCSDSNATAGLFQLPEPGRLGELPQTVIYGPRRFLFDFNLVKVIKMTETANLEFRWEVFNALNNTNFDVPSTNIFDANFGKVLNTITNSRLMQFALKINF